MAVIYNHTLYPGTSEADPAPKTRRWRVEEHLSYLIFVKCCLCEFCRVPCVSCFHGEDVIVRRKLKVMPGMAKMARQSCKAGIPKKGQRWAEGQVRWVRKTFEVLAVCRGKKKGSWRSKVPKKESNFSWSRNHQIQVGVSEINARTMQMTASVRIQPSTA